MKALITKLLFPARKPSDVWEALSRDRTELRRCEINFILLQLRGEDLNSYPMELERALRLLARLKVSVIDVNSCLVLGSVGVPGVIESIQRKESDVRRNVVAEIRKELAENVKIIHGISTCIVGVVFLRWMVAIPNYQDLLRRLLASEYGDCMEMLPETEKRGQTP